MTFTRLMKKIFDSQMVGDGKPIIHIRILFLSRSLRRTVFSLNGGRNSYETFHAVAWHQTLINQHHAAKIYGKQKSGTWSLQESAPNYRCVSHAHPLPSVVLTLALISALLDWMKYSQLHNTRAAQTLTVTCRTSNSLELSTLGPTAYRSFIHFLCYRD